MVPNKTELIRRRAYEIWVSEGYPEGAALRNWQQACAELGYADEHETSQDMRDDRDDVALLQAAGESGDADRDSKETPRAGKRPRSVPSAKPAAPEGTTDAKSSRPKIRKAQGS
jgi:hypothetical protein